VGEVQTLTCASVVTQWNETKVSQFFIQDGHKIEMPPPVWEGLPKEAGLSADMCQKQRQVFKERDFLAENGGWDAHNRQLLEQPMVMVLSIGPDVSIAPCTPYLSARQSTN
jgi:cellulose 1,4-beta-cellobiosidase